MMRNYYSNLAPLCAARVLVLYLAVAAIVKKHGFYLSRAWYESAFPSTSTSGGATGMLGLFELDDMEPKFLG